MSSSQTPPNDARRETSRFVTGRVLAGRYEILERIGEGGTAEVFRARDHRLDRIVAVKVLRPQYGQDEDARARFAVEARSAATLAVSNIVPVFDFGAADDGSLFIVMRYVDGPSLRKVLSEQGALSVGVVLEIGAQIARALAEAHDHGLIHRDVKSGNILIDRDGTAHLADFGTVKALAGSADLTRSGSIIGTAAYLAPEQATGGRIDARTDIYALGVVLYEALTGSPPFRGDDPVAVSYRQAHEAPVPISTVLPSIDPEIADLVMSSLQKDPARRPQTAGEVAQTLESIERRVAVRGVNALPLMAGVPDSVHDVGDGEVELPPPDSETVIIPPVPTAPAAGGFETTAVAPAFFAAASPPLAASAPPPLERGIVTPPPTYPRRTAERRDRGGFGPLLLVGALGLVALVALFLLMRFLAGGDNGVASGPTPTLRSPRASAPVVVVPTEFATPPAATERPTATPVTVTVTPEPPVITPEPTALVTLPPVITPEPPIVTPEPPVITPEPPVVTPEPPAVTPEPPVVTPAPPPSEQRAQIGDESFAGDYPSDGVYHGRTASWVYGQGTAFNTMTAAFSLVAPDASTPARLEMVGLDGENPVSNGTRITINGVTIYEGPSPFPNDTCCGGSGPGNWGTAAFDIPAGVLGVDNTLSVSNLEPTDCTECPKYVMVDFAEVVYATEP